MSLHVLNSDYNIITSNKPSTKAITLFYALLICGHLKIKNYQKKIRRGMSQNKMKLP